jgi:hypothetical protein
VAAYVNEYGCSRETDIYRKLHISAAECARAVQALHGLGMVGTSGGRPRLVHAPGERCQCSEKATESIGAVWEGPDAKP